MGRLTENRLVNDRVGTTFYCFGVELPLFLWSVFIGMTGVMGHDFGIEVTDTNGRLGGVDGCRCRRLSLVRQISGGVGERCRNTLVWSARSGLGSEGAVGVLVGVDVNIVVDILS